MRALGRNGDIGAMRQRVTVTPYTVSSDTAYGGTESTAGTPFEVWADVMPISAGENEYASRLQGTQGFLVRVRYSTAIDQNSTVTYLGNALQVSGPPRVDPHKKYIEMVCEERTQV